MSPADPLTRRTLFGMAAGFMLSGPLPLMAGTVMPAGVLPAFEAAGDPRLHVAGPRDSALAGWARRLQHPIAGALVDGARLGLSYGGGPDGVTASNQFDARVAPDGRDALLFPGSVAMACLTGTAQLRLNPGHMLPLLAICGPAVLMLRGGLDLAAFHRTALRLAVAPQPGGSLTALLGLDLLGVPVRRVAAGPDPALALAAGHADAVFLSGPEAWSRAAALMAAGSVPVLSTCSGFAGDIAPAGLAAPFFLSALPAARLRDDPLVQAWHATAAASALCAMLVLPRLSPAAAIGNWRRAARMAAADGGVSAQARHQAQRVLIGTDAASALAPMRAPPSAQWALRRWMEGRLG